MNKDHGVNSSGSSIQNHLLWDKRVSILNSIWVWFYETKGFKILDFSTSGKKKQNKKLVLEKLAEQNK